MKFGRQRFLRFTVAMALAGIISAQIPVTGVTAFASDTYNGNSGSNSGIRNVIQTAVFLLVAYGIYATVRDSSGAAAGGEVAGATTPAGTTPVAAAAGERTIYDVVKGDPANYKTLGSSIDTAQMVKTYREDGPFTFFAPDETAFTKLPAEQMTSLMADANRPQLQALLSYHTIKGRYTIADLKSLPDGTRLVTLSDTVVVITNTGGLKLNGIPVVETDVPAKNGIVHQIQTVLTPGVTEVPGSTPVATPAAPATDTTPAPAPANPAPATP